ncbi:MAG: class I SAM-dependent methyltransferase [Actinobacteria bacterium]|nr:class I SAM-dependent methyltransferase [Actinomycetota bacterium]
MLASNVDRILHIAGDDDRVLDVGGWARPFSRADWVIDLLPFETRGMYGWDGERRSERFSADSWIQRDICHRDPWPFEDQQFDFAVCSHTLEDVRDPLWVCSELTRVARAGYIETPSRLEEQTYGVHGPWVGWSHHRWLVEEDGRGGLVFVLKPHVLHGRPTAQFPTRFLTALEPEERVMTLWWDGDFTRSERIFTGPGEIDDWLDAVVERNRHRIPPEPPPSRRWPRRRSPRRRPA